MVLNYKDINKAKFTVCFMCANIVIIKTTSNNKFFYKNIQSFNLFYSNSICEKNYLELAIQYL